MFYIYEDLISSINFYFRLGKLKQISEFYIRKAFKRMLALPSFEL